MSPLTGGDSSKVSVPKSVLEGWANDLYAASAEAADERLRALESDLLDLRSEILRYL